MRILNDYSEVIKWKLPKNLEMVRETCRMIMKLEALQVSLLTNLHSDEIRIGYKFCHFG